MDERFKTFTVLIASIGRSIRKIKTEEMAEFDLKSPHVSCLYYLYKAEPMSAKELCDVCEEDKANVSRSIKYLAEKGYVRAEHEHKKRYQTPLVLTEKGRTAGGLVAEKIDSILMAASEGLSEKDREIMYRSLALINDNLQTICALYDGGQHTANN